MIPNEPVRGRTPPPWWNALSGFERIQAFSQALVPSPPVQRLLGMAVTHVVPGTATVAMPATEASLTPNGQLEIAPVLVAALECASITVLPAGREAVPLQVSIHPFRPALVQSGNLIARARVVNSGRLFVFTEALLEDPMGRSLAHASMQTAVRRVSPDPPAPPDPLPRIEEPTYDTPDPYLRAYETAASIEWQHRTDNLETARRARRGTMGSPAGALYGMQLLETGEHGRLVVAIPASEWFCSLSKTISAQILTPFADMAGWAAGFPAIDPSVTLAGLDTTIRFARPAAADGRPITAEARLFDHMPDMLCGDITMRDADGELVARAGTTIARIDTSTRSRRSTKQAQRVLATLLFNDIVDSTGHAERLGDAGWRALLEQYRLAVRRELSRYNGKEVDTAGDGFFVRFDSPAQAIQAARAVRSAAGPLGVHIRTGIHTGECELDGNKPSGMAVHLAARIQTTAAADEVLVSSTVRDLATGSGVHFIDKGEHELKGVPDPWRLFAVKD